MSYKIGIIGATGAVGIEMVRVLKDREFPVAELHLFASERSAGKKLETPFGEIEIELFSVEAAREMDFVFMAVSGDFAKEFAPQIAHSTSSGQAGQGAIVIDNSSAFRYDDAISLVVPEINPEVAKDSKLIANPNCTTAILAVALFPLYKNFGIKRVIVSTYQATSGAGAEGMAELENESKKYLAGEEIKNEIFAHPIPFNLIPHIDVFQDNGFTKEEMKVTWETRKIFGNDELKISCTAVRIPTFRAHAEACTIETEKPITPEAAREILEKAPGVKVVDDPEKLEYPMPLNATKKYDVEVGRIRSSLVFENGLDFFVCGDQLLKGAALNAVQIAEVLV
ncbi:aspartate-semialdehyde dehydrogenase [Candidatus Gracilibacteria bacterium]|nr:aspartate-semialdehyde dehydrogenase [Candidatus Gracilibacteria bacterium]